MILTVALINSDVMDVIYVIIAAATCVGTCFGIPALCADLWKRHLENSDAAKKKRMDEWEGAVARAVVKEIEPLKNDIKSIKQDATDTKQGLQAELRYDIRNSCRRCINQGFRTEDDTTEVVQMYEKYEVLGSNGVTNVLYEDFMKLKAVPNNYISTKKKEDKKRKVLLLEKGIDADDSSISNN